MTKFSSNELFNYPKKIFHFFRKLDEEAVEYIKLFFVNLWVQKQNFVEFVKVASRYYSNISFMKIDLALLSSYFLHSPFKISKKFLIDKGEENIYAYGETPLTTLEFISKQCRITKKDTVLELGCGRGRSCFWLNSFTQCKVIGIEFIPEFVEKANKIKDTYQIQNVEFQNIDMFQADFSKATVIYLYGTCLETDSIKKLITKIEDCPAGTKIITVSYPLSDYTKKSLFEVLNIFPAKFTWGTADVYIEVKK